MQESALKKNFYLFIYLFICLFICLFIYLLFENVSLDHKIQVIVKLKLVQFFRQKLHDSQISYFIYWYLFSESTLKVILYLFA